MNAKVGESHYQLDSLKWLLVVGVVAGGIYANSIYATAPFLSRLAIGLGLVLVAVFVAFYTAKGRAVWELAKEARIELRKVVWPTRTEWTQTTMIVIVAVILVAALLALIDWLLNLAIQGVIG